MRRRISAHPREAMATRWCSTCTNWCIATSTHCSTSASRVDRSATSAPCSRHGSVAPSLTASSPHAPPPNAAAFPSPDCVIGGAALPALPIAGEAVRDGKGPAGRSAADTEGGGAPVADTTGGPAGGCARPSMSKSWRRAPVVEAGDPITDAQADGRPDETTEASAEAWAEVWAEAGAEASADVSAELWAGAWTGWAAAGAEMWANRFRIDSVSTNISDV
mmetsp:Transcript_7472/g.24530  ORF Transcript_7472/g.24530 Transcript_7472/m.24530 type:complete len:220 (-) Transcript_7472:425-1084(-)